MTLRYEVIGANAKGVPATLEIRHHRNGDASFRVSAESARHTLKSGDPVWRLTLAPSGDHVVRYTVEYARPAS